MIETRGLVHRYGSVTALDGVTCDVADGEFVALAGANGSGKTTLVRHWNGLLSPDEGSVRVNGRAVGDDLVAARTAVGMTFQDPRDGIVAATVRGDVAFGPRNLGLSNDAIDERVRDALAAVGLGARGDARIDALSGGERQRVAIAGALAMRPDHLVLDEPFAGLDASARAGVLERLDALHDAGTSVVVVTHDLRDLPTRADRIVGLADGRVAVDAPPDEAAAALEDLPVRYPC